NRSEDARQAFQTALKLNEHSEEASHALASLTAQQEKKERLSKAVTKSRRSINHGLQKYAILLVFVALSVGAYYYYGRVPEDPLVSMVPAEEFETIFPKIISIRKKEDIAKAVLLDGWLTGV